ncbi:MAG: DUF1579 family protein [candidate division Zixibacteria bacterium]
MKNLILLLSLLLIAFSVELAQDSTKQASPDVMQHSPEMGPPPEIQMLSVLEGSWNHVGRMRVTRDAEWTTHESKALFTYIVGGAAMQMDLTGDMDGMAVHGLAMITFDRRTKTWHETWVDNIEGRMYFYSGTFDNGVRIMQNAELMNGETIHTRITTYEITSSGMLWKMEQSTDGHDWWVSMEGTYTKE